MTTYNDQYSLRYNETWLRERVEVSVIKSANYILIEDPATPDHANRLCWAQWTHRNSSVAITAFMWPIALDPDILAGGENIADTQIDAITSAAMPGVIKDFIANPPQGVIIPPAVPEEPEGNN